MGVTDIDLLVLGAAEVTTPTGNEARLGAELGDVKVIENGAVAVDDGRVLEVGPEKELRARYSPERTLDAGGGTVLPGLIDAHTHPVFAGTREREFEQRVAGASYLEIAQAGGGIASSLEGVRGADLTRLTMLLLERADRFLAAGTTTLEAKTGYGLTLEDELRGLEAIAAADRAHPIDLVPTCLAAHAYPPEFAQDRAGYEDLLIREVWPEVARQGIARYADVFTEAHVFDIEASRRVMGAAAEAGLALRMHVDQLTPLGGAELAAELGARSADHLEHVSRAGAEALARSGVVATLSPLVPLYLRETQEAPARRLVQAGVAVALSTDFNPGSCYCLSLFEVCSWAALRYGFSAAEALTAVTLNGAASLDMAGDRGSLEPGKRADLVVTDLPSHLHLTYELGRSPVRAVVKDGHQVYPQPVD